MLLKTGNSTNVCKKIFLVILVKNLNTFFIPSNVIFKMIFRANLLTKIFIIFKFIIKLALNIFCKNSLYTLKKYFFLIIYLGKHVVLLKFLSKWSTQTDLKETLMNIYSQISPTMKRAYTHQNICLFPTNMSYLHNRIIYK